MATSISRTAEAVALARAIESLRPAGNRLFDDPLARGFLRRRWWAALALLRLPGMALAALALQERRFPGVFGSFVCRTRFIDDAWQESLGQGTEQIVILGAGFDSRAYRIAPIKPVRIFEVDRPEMIEVKQARLTKMIGVLPPHVTFVAVDFARQRLSDALPAIGFRENLRTFFLWEGVTQYLSAEAIDAVFDFVATAPPASRIAFTYIDRRILDGSQQSKADQRMLVFVQRLSEPWMSGFDPNAIADRLSKRGLALIEHVGASDFRERYLQPAGRELTLYEHERVVVAEVRGRSAPRSVPLP